MHVKWLVTWGVLHSWTFSALGCLVFSCGTFGFRTFVTLGHLLSFMMGCFVMGRFILGRCVMGRFVCASSRKSVPAFA